MDEKKKCQKDKDLLNAGIAGAAYETVQRYGSAAKQHYVAYSGEDNELGKKLVKGLKQISEEKVNPDYRYQNMHQQAGFSAEVKDVARENAKKIIKGDSTRKIRTDDLGNVNDPLYDTVTLDANGNVIDGSGAQMKFLGASETDLTGEGNATRALEKLQSKKFQKYLDADAKIDIPSEQYDKIIQKANDNIDCLSKQLENQKHAGNSDQVKKIQNRIDNLEKIKKNLRKSNLSSDEAVFARLHPKLSTAMDVAKISHRAGIQTAETSAIIGGSVSIVKNIVAVCKGEEETGDAIKNVAKDTATTAAVGYATGFTGSALKGAMQNSKSQYVRALSKTNVAGTIVAFTVAATKTMSRYIDGEIDAVECLETLGEQGTGMIASSMFTVIGQTVIPIPVVGGLIGGMVGYALSSATYGVLVGTLKEAELAHEERIAIEQVCEEHIKMIREYRAQMNSIINEYLLETTEIFNESFSGIKDALAIGDIDLLIDSSNAITDALDGNKPFETMDEFNNKMLSGVTFKL